MREIEMKCRSLLAGVIMLAQLGGGVHTVPPIGGTTPSGPVLDRLERSLTRPVPTLPAPTPQPSADLWVPDRIVPVPDQPGGLLVPGHWERRLSDGQNYVPPLTATTPDGRTVTLPGGVLPPPQERVITAPGLVSPPQERQSP
jgi:hypothetical protein